MPETPDDVIRALSGQPREWERVLRNPRYVNEAAFASRRAPPLAGRLGHVAPSEDVEDRRFDPFSDSHNTGSDLYGRDLEAHLQDYERQKRGDAATRGAGNFLNEVLKPAAAEWARTAPLVLGAGRGVGGVPTVAGDAPAAAGRAREFFNVNRAPRPVPEWAQRFNLNGPERPPPSGPVADFFNINSKRAPAYGDPELRAALEAGAPARAEFTRKALERQAYEDLMARARAASGRAAAAKNERLMNQVLDLEQGANRNSEGLMNRVLDLEQAANARQVPLRHDQRGYNVMRNPEGIPPAPWQQFRGRYGVAGAPAGASLVDAVVEAERNRGAGQ